MKLKTFAILLSLSAAYSSATHAMNSDAEFLKVSQRIRAADEKLSKAMQRIPAERDRQREEVAQARKKWDALDSELIEEGSQLMDALNAGTITAEEMTQRFNELNARVKAEKEAVSQALDQAISY
ncbi:MAG: hypothetical protein K2X28_04660 [Alphaproteobacteria bacterium]|nr:hypothetical protein [Alphaproteobacteria bacterium]